MTEEIIKDCVFCENGRTCNIYPWTCDYDGCCSSNEECPIKEMIAKLSRLEQENKVLKDNNNHLQVIIDDGRAENKRFREENKELKSQRDEARIAYNSLILDIVSDIPFKGEVSGERYISIKDHLHQMQKALASLEEIRKVLTNEYYIDTVKAIHKINEVLGDEV